MMEDSISTAGVMVGLRSLGVRLSVDDFGTGFSQHRSRRSSGSRCRASRSTARSCPVSATINPTRAGRGDRRHASRSDGRHRGVSDTRSGVRLFELGCTEAQGGPFATAVPYDEVPPTLAFGLLVFPLVSPDAAQAGLPPSPCGRRAGRYGRMSRDRLRELSHDQRLAIEDLDQRAGEVVGDPLGQLLRAEHLAIEVTDVEHEHATRQGGHLPQLGGSRESVRAESAKPWSRRVTVAVFTVIGLYGGAVKRVSGSSSKLLVTIAKPTGSPACQPTILSMRGLASSASTSSREYRCSWPRSRAGYELVLANNIKAVVNLSITTAALPFFIARGEVEWAPALVLAAGFTPVGGCGVGAARRARGGEQFGCAGRCSRPRCCPGRAGCSP